MMWIHIKIGDVTIGDIPITITEHHKLLGLV